MKTVKRSREPNIDREKRERESSKNIIYGDRSLDKHTCAPRVSEKVAEIDRQLT